eukprot:jgi/Chrzof1/4264/Cz14g05140.t1
MQVLTFEVGILTPNWLDNATHLGQDVTDTFVCDVYTKEDFIKYYVDKDTSQPVRWTFLGSGADFHVLSFTPNTTLSDAHWQAPEYCFTGNTSVVINQPLATGRLLRMHAVKQIQTELLSKHVMEPLLQEL